MSKLEIALAAITFACLSFSTGANAQEREAVRAHIPYADLDLSTQAGLDSLNHRIARGIRRACGQPTVDLSITADIQRCMAEMRADSSHQIATLEKRKSDVRIAAIGR